MKYLKRRRFYNHTGFESDHDPMSGMGNLFDIGLVFIVALMLALVSALNVVDFFDKDTQVTVVSKNRDGRMRIITKRGKSVKIQKISGTQSEGEEGVKLGTAYRLRDGRMIYIPEEPPRDGR